MYWLRVFVKIYHHYSLLVNLRDIYYSPLLFESSLESIPVLLLDFCMALSSDLPGDRSPPRRPCEGSDTCCSGPRNCLEDCQRCARRSNLPSLFMSTPYRHLCNHGDGTNGTGVKD
ncbi:hypothetical protein Mapa_004635 [Marchantia paleacea]|nr:hypothetical protein Mapa_004635 [Marchantia paleacea]